MTHYWRSTVKRNAYQELTKWKNDDKRKPLLLQGARQVGKTFLVDQFGNSEYSNYIYLNFEQDKNLHDLFKRDLAPNVILNNISLYIGKKISAENTLLFFDEVQFVPEVITSLKYFYENAPEFHIVAAGSLFGVAIGQHRSFPVGKVNFMTLYPMTFFEYSVICGFVGEKYQMCKNIKLDLITIRFYNYFIGNIAKISTKLILIHDYLNQFHNIKNIE